MTNTNASLLANADLNLLATHGRQLRSQAVREMLATLMAAVKGLGQRPAPAGRDSAPAGASYA